jgi:hypothetical protein
MLLIPSIDNDYQIADLMLEDQLILTMVGLIDDGKCGGLLLVDM